MSDSEPTCTAFQGVRRIAAGGRPQIALLLMSASARHDAAPVLVFDDRTGKRVEFDLRGTAEEVAARLAPPREEDGAIEAGANGKPVAGRGPGRPKLGVVAREVTLLPRHWDWLTEQPGGASVALRNLIDAARTANAGRDRVRQAKEAADRFMGVMAGDEPGYEEASRALYAGDRARFEALTASWPPDVRDHARRLAEAAFDPGAASTLSPA